jgi:hypothetical protein
MQGGNPNIQYNCAPPNTWWAIMLRVQGEEVQVRRKCERAERDKLFTEQTHTARVYKIPIVLEQTVWAAAPLSGANNPSLACCLGQSASISTQKAHKRKSGRSTQQQSSRIAVASCHCQPTLPLLLL